MADLNSKISDFSAIRLKLASPENILDWSHGEITKPETINYRTQKPEKDGLFCERIFGPVKDWECYCGKYRRIRYKGIVCDKCGVEVTRSIVRRERMGHIKLAVPVSHIWFLRSVPSQIGLLLEMSPQALEKVIYFANYIIINVNEDARKEALEQLEKEYKQTLKEIKKVGTAAEAEDIKRNYDKSRENLKGLHKLQILSEVDYHNLSLKYGHIFKADIGAEAIRNILTELNLSAMAKELTALKDKLYAKEIKSLDENSEEESSSQYSKIIKRLKLITGLLKAEIKPEWMFLTVVPVISPDLRPMVALDGGRFATSDLNDLYRRVINRNNRLKRLLELDAPEVICRNEKRMLQEAVDALIDNSARRGQMVTASTGQKRLLRSLADMLKGKQGRFRQNLLGKRVDYSGRSVIVVGPHLNLHECGLPKVMALELFKPFVINKLIEKEITHNVRSATRLIEQGVPEVYDILEEVSKKNFVLLNRAPTLHRLGIQAFRPILIEGKAIQVHPMVCAAFNADFDGDQMAVHVVLTKEAKKEAEEIMLSSLNLLKPSTGEPVASPSQDIVLGCYYMTTIEDGQLGEGKIFSNENEAIMAYREKYLDLKAKIKCLIDDPETKKQKLVETCVGRILFNQAINPDLRFINDSMNKKNLKKLVARSLKECGIAETSQLLDSLKNVGFHYATISGISWGMGDLKDMKEKDALFAEADQKVNMIQEQYESGLLTDRERKDQTIEVWHETKGKIADLVPNYFQKDNSVYSMINSGARGDWSVITQMMGMKGLVINPAGDVIELPVKNSLKEGLNVLEYFISTHGARKGLADTALKTSKAGYLTRRLVDVSQDIIIQKEDCGDKEGFEIFRKDGDAIGVDFEDKIKGRIALTTIKNIETDKVIVKGGEVIDVNAASEISESSLESIKIRNLVSCKANIGVCQKCYGNDLTTGALVKLGSTVGVVAAQAIGEPGTQLTMRTFHAGGVAVGSDITQGLPRVEEIFEARSPKGKSIISTVDGSVEDIVMADGKKFIKIRTIGQIKKSKKNEVEEIATLATSLVLVNKGDLVTKGQQLTDGSMELQELYKNSDKGTVQRYIINSVQAIYVMQGEYLNEKHIEVIVRQMFSRIKVMQSGDTDLLPGSIVELGKFNMANDESKKHKGKLASGELLLMGITKAALNTESFLSAASFQETTRVLVNAAVMGKVDHLRGLKENVIIGKLIKAGTGFKK